MRAQAWRARAGGRLVRYFHVEGTIPRGREEDDGSGGCRATWMALARRDLLSHGRRCRFDWHVEGFRRTGATQLAKFPIEASQNGSHPGCRVRAYTEGVGGREERLRGVEGCPHICFWSARAQGLWRLSDSRLCSQERRNSHRYLRRRHADVIAGMVARRRNLLMSGRCRSNGGLRQAVGERVPEA